MSVMALLLWFIGVLSVSLSSQAGLTVEAEPGDDVTLWCKHSLTLSSYLFWLKQTNNSAPDHITCKYYSVSSSSSNSCFFIPESERSVMGVNSTFSSLTITAVTPSDSGLYYCSTQKEQFMTFSTTTRLQIRERSDISSKNPDKSEESCSPPKLFHLLTLMFGAVIAVLLSVLLILIFTRQTDRKDQRDGSAELPLLDQHLQWRNTTAVHYNQLLLNQKDN
uniref:Ig-like domain-containing protein n=1 Tax=Pygocentrus nattereri TaxID=42514 RepID=A0AAR2KX36_PYGNA